MTEEDQLPAPRTDRAHVVILTAGALPGQDTPAPHATQLAAVPDLKAALTRFHDLGLHGGEPAVDAAVGAALDRVATAYWRAGWAEAAKEHRVVAVYVLPGDREAADFAAFMTREIDPAYVVAASSPLAELMASAENAHRGLPAPAWLDQDPPQGGDGP